MPQKKSQKNISHKYVAIIYSIYLSVCLSACLSVCRCTSSVSEIGCKETLQELVLALSVDAPSLATKLAAMPCTRVQLGEPNHD